MATPSLIQREIQDQIMQLEPAQQHKVLEYVRSLFSKKNTGESLLSFAGSIDKADLELMTKAIIDNSRIIWKNKEQT